jgi:hypothetical protein
MDATAWNVNPWVWVIVAVIIALVVIAILAWMTTRQRRSRRLREHFGPEYHRVATSVKDEGRAEKILEERRKRVEKLDIRPLSAEDRGRFGQAWREAQARFVDSPSDAITEGDRLVTEVMRARGYPTDDFDQRAADISVDHPHVVSNYRSARSIALKNERGEATTEDLRMAMVHYRSLFDELLGAQETAGTEAQR